jgi:hypothetical protein
MTINYRNLIWIIVVASLFYVYFSQLAGYWLDTEWVDPLIINFIITPAVFGLVTFIGLRGKMKQRAIFLFLMPIVPCLILGQEGDPAKPGLQWVLMASMQLPYWCGGVVGILVYLRKSNIGGIHS